MALGSLPSPVTAGSPSSVEVTITDTTTPAPTALTLSADSTPAEGGSAVTVTATLNQPAPSGGTTVTLTTGGTATSGADYRLSPTTIAIAAGATSGAATITVVDDSEDDDGETIVLNATATNPTLTAATLTLTIGDNDRTLSSDASLRGLTISAGGLAFDPATTSYAVDVPHGVSSVTVTPTANHPGATITVNGAAVASGTASPAIALAVGGNAIDVVVTAEDRTTTRTYTVTVTRSAPPTGVGPPSALTLSAAPAPAEGGPTVTLTATLDQPAPDGGTTVTLTTSGTATRGADYTLSPATIAIAAGATSGTATITVVDDTEDDAGETITLDAAATNPALTAATLTLTIEDNDDAGPAAPPTALTLSAAPAPAEGGPAVTVTATLDQPAPDGGTTVTLTAGGTATPGADYTLSSSTIAIAAGQTSGTATITVVDDAEADAGETIALDAAATNPALTAATLTLIIEDNDDAGPGPPTVGAPPTALTLGANPAPAEGGADVTVTATLDEPAPDGGTTVTLTTGGTATPGADYTLSSSTIAIAAGGTSGAATITVVDDAEDDDGETITLDAAATNPALTAATLVLTIEDNDDAGPGARTAPPPSAWLARFARAVTDHAVDALGARLADDGRGRSYAVFAGMPLWGGADGPAAASAAFGGDPHGMIVGPRDPGSYGAGAGFDAGGTGGFAFPMANGTLGPAGGGGVAGMPFVGPGAIGTNGPGGAGMHFGGQSAPSMHGPGAGAGLTPPLLSGPGRGRRFRDGMPTRPLDALLGSSFRLSSQTGGGATSGRPRLAAWGHASGSFFDGAESGAELDGEVASWLAGVDAGWRRWLAGVAVAHSRGHGWSYGDGTSLGVGAGEFTGTLTAVHPYVRFRASERVSAWGMLGYGAGGLTLQGVSEFGWRTDTALRMAAGGARGVFLRGRSGLELAGKFDARRTHVASDAADGRAGRLAATAGDISRVRMAFEGSRRFTLRGRRLLTPVVEIGLRRDGGVAENGFGLDLGGALRWADPQRGLVVEAAGRVLATHQDEDYREWGASASVRLDPGRAGRGLALALTPSWGAAPAGGADRLWSLRDARALAARGGPPGMRRRGGRGLRARRVSRTGRHGALRGHGVLGVRARLARRRALEPRPVDGVRRRGRPPRVVRYAARPRRGAHFHAPVTATRRRSTTEAF